MLLHTFSSSKYKDKTVCKIARSNRIRICPSIPRNEDLLLEYEVM